MGFRLTRGEVHASIADRFGRWAAFLADRRAIPILVLGMTADGSGELEVCCCAGIESEDLGDMLRIALAEITAGTAREV